MDRFKDETVFLDRQLNETKYLSRIARQYLAHLYNEKAEGRLRVRAIPGKLTAMLRAKWGLNALLRGHNVASEEDDGPTRKNRDNHMHHAIDAFVIGMTDQRLLQAIANLNSEADRRRLIDQVPPPWKGFTPDELCPHLDRLVVSHKPDHGTFPWTRKTNDRNGNDRGKAQTSGALHNDTAYGLVERGKNGNWKVVSRAPLSAFNTPEAMTKALPDVRDRALREALTAEWESFQKTYKPESEDSDDRRKKKNPAMVFADRVAIHGVKVNGHTVKVRRVRMIEELDVVIVKDRKTGRPYKAYKPDGNAFADLYELPNGKWRAVVIRRFDANQSDVDLARFRPHPAAKKIARLHIDDMVAIGEGAARRILRIVKMSGQTITMADHFEGGALKARDADKDDIFKYFAPSASKLKELGFRKVGVDEIGRLTDPGPRKPRPAA
jgi:CRISPR-associated endonuclease Csn1